ncbi:MAG TPA: hypothetical protein VHD90_01010, partial [Phototrophicaceae bacterium]|nr:hypothetical protein [Phototrophicaceae bacterium]
LNNWNFAILPIGVPIFFVIIIGGGAAYWISHKRGWKTISFFPLLMILIYGFVGITITTSYTYISLVGGKIRHSLPITVGLIGLWAAFISQIYWTLREFWHTRPQRWFLRAALTCLALIVAFPLVMGSISSVRQFNLVPTQLVAQNYSNASLPADGLVLFYPMSAVAGLFNREWSGYSGATTFNWWFEDPTTSSPQALAQRGITYFVIENDDWNWIQDAAQLRQYVDQLTFLRTIKAGAGQTGPSISFYRILPPEVTASVMFGDQIRLEGYDLSAASAAPGQRITFRPYWRALSQPKTNYSMFVHIYPQGTTNIVTQHDGTPALSGHPTLTWDEPSELIMGDQVTLTIPAGTPPGDYVIALGLYDYTTGQRLPTSSGDTFEIPIRITG